MMQDISTTLKGRIGSVPTMKHIKGDTCVTTFRLAIPRWRFTVDARTGNASYVEDGAYWYTIETWDKLADNVVRCCCNGDRGGPTCPERVGGRERADSLLHRLPGECGRARHGEGHVAVHEERGSFDAGADCRQPG